MPIVAENRQLASCSRSDNLETRLLGGIFENIINLKKIIMETREIQIDFCKHQIDFFKKQLAQAEYYVKIWRIHKMVTELFLWHDITNKFNLYDIQYKRLEKIREKIEAQFNNN